MSRWLSRSSRRALPCPGREDVLLLLLLLVLLFVFVFVVCLVVCVFCSCLSLGLPQYLGGHAHILVITIAPCRLQGIGDHLQSVDSSSLTHRLGFIVDPFVFAHAIAQPRDKILEGVAKCSMGPWSLK